jgi:hypothetical protein
MPKKSNKRSNKRTRTRTRTKTRKQKPVLMIGCSSKKGNKKSHRNNKVFLSLGNKSCPKCGTKCHCGPKCKCPHNCPGTCYLNRRYKGGSGCGSTGCPIAPLSTRQMDQFGGTCQTCSIGGKIPPPFVPPNSPWGPPVHKWPGVDGVPNSRNYLAPYNTDNNPQQQMSMTDAGYKTPNSLVGGGLIPQDMLNLGRDFSYNFKSAYNALNGYKPPVDPAPYKGQLTGALNYNKFNF